jgi:hypothetical protein
MVSSYADGVLFYGVVSAQTEKVMEFFRRCIFRPRRAASAARSE